MSSTKTYKKENYLENGKIIHGDCLKVLKTLPEDKFILNFTSPPYFNAINYEEHIEKLFGPGYMLRKKRELVQPGEYAAEETVKVTGPRGDFSKVRVLGPPRRFSQVEISRTDTFYTGIRTEVRMSGDIEGTPGAWIVGPYGSVELSRGVIVAQRHIHMTPADATRFKVKDGQKVRVRTRPPRAVVFEDVVVRVDEKFKLECHLDTDEANACDLQSGTEVFLS